MDFINKATGFVKEAYYELKQVSWLGRKELLAQTTVVVLLIVIVALFVSTVDLILSKVIAIIL